MKLPSEAIGDATYEALFKAGESVRSSVGADCVFVLSLTGNKVAVAVAHKATLDLRLLAAALRELADRLLAGDVDQASPPEGKVPS